MEDNISNLLRSELYMASSYVERLFHALIDLTNLQYHPNLHLFQSLTER